MRWNQRRISARFSCRGCIFSTDHDLIQITNHDPFAFARVSDLEQWLGFTMRSGETLLEILEKLLLRCGRRSDKTSRAAVQNRLPDNTGRMLRRLGETATSIRLRRGSYPAA